MFALVFKLITSNLLWRGTNIFHVSGVISRSLKSVCAFIISTSFNLADFPFKSIPKESGETTEFDLELPASKVSIKWKLLNGWDEKQVEEEIKQTKKFGQSAEMTTRLRHIIVEVNGEREKSIINNFVNNLLLSRDSLYLRTKIQENTPDILLKQEVELEGDVVEVDIPLTPDFFWPTTIK